MPPETEPSQELSSRRLLGLLAALLAGIGLALAAMPLMFRATPTDVSRIGTILEALRAPGFEPRICVFGNSVIMSGIDGRRLSQALPGHPLAVNLASTGQSTVESYLLQQELPDSVRVVVQHLAVSGAGEENPLEEQKYNTFYMYGFRPSEDVRRTLDEIYGDSVSSILAASGLSQRFQARWALRQLVDTRVRLLLRRDLTLSTAETDLYHPQRYATPVGPGKLARSVQETLTRLEGGLGVSARRRQLIAAAAASARERGRELFVLLPPVHPRIRSALGPALPAAIGRLVAELQPVRVIDATESLTEAHFIDALHPTNSGAEIATDLLARQLAAR